MNPFMREMIYSCTEIRDFVFDYAEGALDPWISVRFKLHLSMCKDCEEYVRLYRMAADSQSFRQKTPPPPELVEKTKDFLMRSGIADFTQAPDAKTSTKTEAK